MNQKRKKLGRKLLSFLLTLAMVVGLMPGLSVTAYAATDPVPYICYTGNASTEGACTDYTTVATDTTTWGTAGNTTWYVVSGEVTISSRVIVNGTVNLILRDGAKLTVNGGIGLNDGNTLNIYPETEDGTGELNAVASTNYCAGIGGAANNGYSVACGTLTIHGGVIKAMGAENGPGIGNGGQGCLIGSQAAGTVIIYAGNVTATGGFYGDAGIGGGWAGTGGCNVEIYGGTVLANVGTSPNGAQGIGYAGGNTTKYPGTLKIGAGVKVYSDAAGATEIAAGPQDNVASRTNTMFVKKVKLAQTVTPPTAATDLKYQKDQAQALLTEGASVSEGNGNTEATIQYSLTPDDDTSWVADYTDVKATNAGIHKVYYRVAGNDTYDDFVSSDEQVISVTIAKADPATPTGITAKYCDNTGEIDLPDGWKWQNDWHFFETVGTDTCKADFAGNDNYNAMTGVDITVTVEKADAAISYEKTEVSVEYGAEFGKNEITNPGDADPTFTSTNKSVATVSETGYVTIKGIGETTITATIEDNEHYHYTTTQASYKLTVNPVTTEITTVPTAAGLTFGQKLSESKLTGGKAVLHGKWAVDGTFAWKEPDTVPNASDSGEYVVVFTPDNANYSTAECNVKLTVKKASPTVTAPTAKTLNYTGSPVSLVNAGSTGDGTLYYALGENGTTAPDFDGASDTADKKWSTSIPTATNAGTYYVWYKVIGDENHIDYVPENPIEVKIAKKKATIKAKDQNVALNGKIKEAIDQVSADGLADEHALSKITLTSGDTDHATENGVITPQGAVITASDEDVSANYDISYENGKLTVQKGTAAVKSAPGAKELIYTGQAQELVTAGTAEKGTMEYILGTDAETAPQADAAGSKWSRELPSGTEAKTYYVWYKAAGDNDYNDSKAECVTVEIKAATPEPTAAQTATPEPTASQTTTPKPTATQAATPEPTATQAATPEPTATQAATPEPTATQAVTPQPTAAQTAAPQSTAAQPATAQAVTPQAVSPSPKTDNAAKNTITLNAGFKISQTGSNIQIKWGRIKEADGYEVYVAYCSQKFNKPVSTLKKNTKTSVKVTKLDGKKINLKKNFKAYVVAYKLENGKKVRLAKTIVGHVVGRQNKKYSNAKKITLEKSSCTLTAGKTMQVKAKTVLVDKTKKQLSDAHAKEFRYVSTDKAVATVSSTGLIKGVGAGTCTVYVYARNGYAKTVKVTVKKNS